MPLVSILAMAWLLMVPASGTISLQQDAPPASAGQSPVPAPADAPQAATTKSEPPAADKEASGSTAKKKTAGAPAAKPRKRHRVRKSAPKPTPAGEPRKIVVRDGGAIEPPAQIMPGLTPEEASQQRQNAKELLNRTEEDLKRLAGRTLDSLQEETVAQIHNYVDGARSALQDGDTQRAHTLALKAHLLADDLVKH
jgi:hypothetical protein